MAAKSSKRDRILQAAAESFAAKEYHEVRTDDIAAAARVGKGTVFRYFPTKEELFIATLVHSIAIAIAEIDQALAGIAGPIEKLSALCRHLTTFYQRNRHLFRLLHSEKSLAEQPQHEEWHKRQAELRERIASIVREGQETGCFRKLDDAFIARLLFGMIRAALRSEIKAKTAPEIADSLLEVFLYGIAKQKGNSG